MYDIGSVWVAAALFASMLVAIEAGLRVGLSWRAVQTEAAKGHINAVQASFFGVLALLLGFTFSLSLSRYDSRSVAVVDEANAIGTAYLRADLVPEAHREEVKRLLRGYLDLRVRSSQVTLDHDGAFAAQIAEAERLQDAIWGVTRQVAAEKPDAIGAGFVQSINPGFRCLASR